MKKNNFILSIFFIYIIIFILVSPSRFITATLNGLSVWTFNVLPSILPFMIFTSLLINLGSLNKVAFPFSKILNKFYRMKNDCGYVFLLSILAGYPIGSKMISDLYERGKITQNEAYKMCSFCSNSGPMFILGSVGVGMFGNQKIGYILLISHILSAIFNGFLYRNIKYSEEYYSYNFAEEKSISFGEICSNAIQGVLNIAVIISIFFVITEGLSPITNLLPNSIQPIFKGLLEMTQGCLLSSKNLNGIIAPIICSFLISFGGISTLLQSITALKKVNIPTRLFTLQKITQGIISCFITTLLILI